MKLKESNPEYSVNIIGAGLAGSECAYQLLKRGVHVNLYEMKPPIILKIQPIT